MPGYVIHLSEAILIMKQFEQKNIVSEQWRANFLLGALLPDACQGHGEKSLTHFWKEEDLGKRIIVPDLVKFEKKYSIHFQEAVVFGYFSHLYLDYYFYKEYWPKVLEFRTEKNIPSIDSQIASHVWLKKQNCCISAEDFFSEAYSYGDYTKMNVWFCEKYQLQVPKYERLVGRVPEEAKEERLPRLLEDLNEFLRLGDEIRNEMTKIFDVVEVDNFLQEIAERFYHCYC